VIGGSFLDHVGGQVFGPQSWLVFLTLVTIFAGMAYGIARVPHLALRMGAGVVAFAVAAVFGIAGVNRFYDYYQSWGAIASDISGQPSGVVTALPALGQHSRLLPTLSHTALYAKRGLLISTALPGAHSHISRNGLIYLPPQYFQPRYVGYRFPALELLHGSPGQPLDWETALHTSTTYFRLVTHGLRPVVLVIPDANGSLTSSSQCLDEIGGPLNDTYLSQDVPADITASLRVQPPGPHWGVAGYSEGGFCAANLALRHPTSYGAAGVMSGYFQPISSGQNGRDPFHGDVVAEGANDPMSLAARLNSQDHPPAFWVMSGKADTGDLLGARLFTAVLRRHEKVPLLLVAHGGHTFAAWLPALPKMLSWAADRLSAGLPRCPHEPSCTEAAARPILTRHATAH
jgi:pimeloyl-ACP methyl ester carboxylesterase